MLLKLHEHCGSCRINPVETFERKNFEIVSFKAETLNSGTNLPLQTSSLQSDIPVATFKNMLKYLKRVSEKEG